MPDSGELASAPLVLYVDDERPNRIVFEQSLKSEFRIKTVADAKSALARLAKEHFDCTLLDYRMPGSDGLDVVRLARDKGILVPFIMLTGFGDEQTAVELMKAGAADYIPKSSLTPERLALSLRGVLKIHQAEIEASRAEGHLRRYADQLGAVAMDGDVSGAVAFRAPDHRSHDVRPEDGSVLSPPLDLSLPLAPAEQLVQLVLGERPEVGRTGDRIEEHG